MNRKTISRTIILLAVSLTCTAIVAFYYVNLHWQERNSKTDMYELVPEECEAVMEITNLRNVFMNLQFSSFAYRYDELQISDIIRQMTDKIINLSEQEAHSIGGQMNHLLVSFHAPYSKENHVVYGHLNNDGRKFVEAVLKTKEYKKAEYKGEDIIIYPIDNKRFVSCFFEKGFYAISYRKRLIEQVIDTYHKSSPSLRDEATFSALPNVKKPANSLYLYARCQPLADWIEFNLRMHDDAIYLAGNCPDNSETALAHLLTQGEKGSLISESMLPNGTRSFYQMPLRNNEPAATDSPERVPTAFDKFAELYADGEVTGIEFAGKDTVNVHVVVLPLSQPITGLEPEWKALCKGPGQYRWVKGKAYLIRPLQESAFEGAGISPYFPQEGTPVFAVLYDEMHLLLSDKRENLVAFLPGQKGNDAEPTGLHAELSNLAQKTHFTFFGEMGELYDHPNYAAYIPKFIANHRNFFEHFDFTLQLTKATERINADIILTYKGF